MFKSMPTIHIVTNNDVPPYLINGIGTPVAGTKELATDILIKACEPIENVKPTASNLPNISLQEPAILIPRKTNHKNSQIIAKQPKKPHSSAITA